jgi:5-methyltetrahydropteroyltriglutamate--homocysteine methyltransferase
MSNRTIGEQTYDARLVGYPRIGPARELKWALEGRWAGRLRAGQFDEQIAGLRAGHVGEQLNLVGSATDDFFLYDMALETAIMLGAVPSWARHDDPFETVSVLARGSPEHGAWEMTKWFDTNYHYVVPEIEAPPEMFTPLPWREPLPGSTWVVLGPYSLVKLCKPAYEPEVTVSAAARALWSWATTGEDFRLQVDEPCLGLVLDASDRRVLEAAYGPLPPSLRPLVSIQFGRADAETVQFLSDRGAVVQVPHTMMADLASIEEWARSPERLVSVLDGRSVWADDPAPVEASLSGVDFGDAKVHLTPSTSLMFLPYTTDGEELPAGFEFARQKATSLAAWSRAFNVGERPPTTLVHVPEFPEVGGLVTRESREERRTAQSDLDLPAFPTTTIGSLPQTADVRRLRTDLRKGALDVDGYEREIDRLIRDGIKWQEEAGLDVLVHGEFERTDMVEYFGERMDGFLTTRNGWVNSYGSRCVRPPIIAAPPSISAPMTVREWKVAQESSDKPVKAMLTGPVTIVNWSFRPRGVPDDKLFWAVAHPVAQEVAYLLDAGARVIQIDEPAVRERWPLPTSDAVLQRSVYARGVRAALNRVFAAPPHVQMHTHMCYGTDASIAELFNEAGVDVASIYYARSRDDERIRAFYELFSDGHMEIGPGAFDVHSPHSPGTEAMEATLLHVLGFMEPVDLWVNPDCGLKTRSWGEVEVQVADMVEAARRLREAATP